MSVVIPDFEWYSKASSMSGTSPRCPFATASRCPRYFQSISLLERTGATSIEPATDSALFRRWKESPLWPLMSEQTTSVHGGSDDPAAILSNFCPEVSYDRFGLFASHLARYADELDVAMAHRSLAERSAPRDDWRWQWSSVRPQHYSECPLYSLLQRPDEVAIALEHGEELLEIKPGVCGISVNVKALITRFCVWWLKKREKKNANNEIQPTK